MANDLRFSPDRHTIDRQIKTAQAMSLLDGIAVSLASSCFIALTTAGVLWIHRPGYGTLLWLVALVGLNFARFLGVSFIKRRNLCEIAPTFVLDALSLSALCAGLLWAFAPFMSAGDDGPYAYIIFIIAGISAGALIQSTAYSRTAIVFAGPPLMATLILLLQTATVLSMMIALNVLLLIVMLLRASRMSEAGFIRSQEDRLRAIGLARSLGDANAEITLSNRQLETLANLDPLTGLSNRALFNRRLNALTDRPDASQRPFALLIVDLDRFKNINDTMGHGAGDTVLVQIGKRLSLLAGEQDIVVRLGGDEFAVIVDGQDALTRAETIANSILGTTNDPVIVSGRPVIVGSSVGLAVFPDHGSTAEALFASADIALYAAKEGGRRRFSIFNPALKAQIDRQRVIETSLPNAIESGEIHVVFQPQVTLSGNRVVGFEALIRWTHPVLGRVSPPEMVLAAQVQHLSDRLTRHVACAAASLARRLPGLGLADAIVSINVSPREFSTYSLSAMLMAVVAEHGIAPSQLEIEITEEATLDTATAGEELAKLGQAGFRLAVDDFGMGHSSLAYLVSLRIDRLKIDRSFVEGISASRQNQALISALIGIGHALSIDIVVEGVETAEEAGVLRMIGCQVIQGYHTGRPMPVEALEDWLAGQAEPPLKPALSISA